MPVALSDPPDALARVLDLVPEIAFIVDVDGRIVLANRAFMEALGMAEAPTGRRIAEFVAEPAETVETYLRHCAGVADPLTGSLSFRARSGEVIACRAEGASLAADDRGAARLFLRCTPKGEANRLVAQLRQKIDELSAEIGRGRRLETSLRELAGALERRVADRTEALVAANSRLGAAEESHDALFQKAPVPMHALDAERRILDVNEEWLGLFGYARGEVIGRPVAEFHAPGNAASHAARWRELIETGVLRDVERQYVKKSGEVFDGLVSAYLERDRHGGFVRSITTVIDITQRKRAEAAAREERLLWELLVENSTEGIIAVDSTLRYTLWNPAMEALSAIPRERILGRSLLDTFPHLAGTPIEAGWRGALAGTPSLVRDWPFDFVQTGRKGFLDQAFAPLHGGDRAVVGAIGFVHDTTEKHEAEEMLRRAQRLEALGQLTGGVAHDFNNILTAIIGTLDLVLGSDDIGPSARRWLSTASRSAARGSRLTQQLLSFARKQVLHARTLNLNHLLTELQPLLQRAAGDSISLVMELGEDLAPCRVDSAQFEAAILNLVTNARDAMPQGGTLRIGTRTVGLKRDAEAVKPGDYVVLSVTDTGTGIAPDILPRVFEPFFTTKEVGKGSGLGLPMVYGFAQQSGGSATVSSTLGRGTEVRIYLPIAEGETAQPAEDGGADVVPVGSGTVLVVDDNEDVRLTLSTALKAMGYAVVTAEDGPTALALLHNGATVDLMLSDVVMPGGVSGLDLSRSARRLRPGLPVLLMSGYSSELLRELENEAGIRLLTKPFRPAELAQVIDELLRSERDAPKRAAHSA